MSKIRNAYAVLADFQAFKRFKVMNSGSRSTPWSHGREDELRSILTNELGAVAMRKLEMLTLLFSRAPFLEEESLTTITEARREMGDRDVPQTRPPDEWPVI